MERNPDLTVLSMGGGIQTSAIAEMIVAGDLPLVDVAIFADTGNEGSGTYDQIEYLRDRLGAVGVDLITVRRSEEGIISDAFNGARFAAIPLFIQKADGKRGRLRRQCTREYKTEIIEKAVRRILVDRDLAVVYKRSGHDYVKRNEGVFVDMILGISKDEAVRRMSDNPVPWITNTYPLVDLGMSRGDCVSYLREKDLPIPPRSACLICPFRGTGSWSRMDPDEFAQVVDFDQKIRSSLPRIQGDVYLSDELIPVDQAVAKWRKRPVQLDLFADLCDGGYCGV